MKGLRFQLDSEMNFFRLPEFHTYQKTLLFPPKTTVVGLINNSMGKSINEYYELLKQVKTSVVIKEISAVDKDVWRFIKVKATEMVKDICIREFVFNSKYVVYVTALPKLLRNIKTFLRNPKRILYLGRDDNLVMVSNIEDVKLKKTKSTRIDSVIDFDITLRDYNMRIRNQNIIIPTVVNLPLEFKLGRNKERAPTKIQPFSYWYGIDIEFKEYVNCWTDGKYNIRLF